MPLVVLLQLIDGQAEQRHHRRPISFASHYTDGLDYVDTLAADDQLHVAPGRGPSALTPGFIILSIILSTIIICTFLGNLFVIVAIFIDKNLQTAANQLVLSLAFADLMVACLVMPLGAYNDIYQGWYLGTEVCEFWTSADVLCCTGKRVPLA